MRFLIALSVGVLMIPRAFAQNDPTTLPEPLSPYVKQVLERADRIEQNYLTQLSASPNCEEMKDNAVDIALVDVRKQIDAVINLIAQADDLSQVTACQRYDLDIIERKLQMVREQMIEMTNACELSTLKALALIHNMLGTAYEAVLRGGLNPRYADFQLRRSFLNDQAIPDSQVCPFSSDYAPASLAEVAQDNGASEIRSVGCDSEALGFIAGQDIPEPRKQEAEQAQSFLSDIEEIASDLGGQILAFEYAFRSVFSIVRGDPLPPPVNPERPPHAAINGCRELVVQEDLNGDGTPDPNVFMVRTWDVNALPRGLLLHTTSDPFSIFRSPVSLNRQFIQAYNDRGRERMLLTDTGSDVFMSMLFYQKARQLSDAAANMEQESAAVAGISEDALKRMFTALTPLRSAVRGFGEIASFPPPGDDRPLLQSFIRDLALFLRRSCVWGFCNDTLDAVLKRVLNEHCYPYGSGCFYTSRDYIKKCYENTETEC